MSIQKIIQESINGKPLEMKEAFAEELRNRVAEALAAKMEEVELDEAEQIDEISKATLGSYIKKAGGTSLNSAGAHMADYGANRNPKSFKKGINRAKGVMRAADRLTKEEVDLDEALKIGSKVRIHAPGKDYHGKIGHVGEIRKRTYGTMAPSYTVDYREPGDEYNRSISLSREKIKLHREEVELGESSGIHDIKSLQKHFEGPTAYDAAAHSPAMMMRRKGLDGKKYDLIKVGNGKYRAELSEEADLEEAVEVRHDRYMRSHGKKARDTGHPGSWMFTHKEYGTPDYNDDKEVHTVRGKFADAKKSAQKWAKEHGHRSVYVMEEVEIDESFGAAIKKAEASRQRALKKAASMVKRGFSHEEAAKNHDVKVADLKKHMGE